MSQQEAPNAPALSDEAAVDLARQAVAALNGHLQELAKRGIEVEISSDEFHTIGQREPWTMITATFRRVI